MIKNGFLPLKNSVRARLISAFEEYLSHCVRMVIAVGQTHGNEGDRDAMRCDFFFGGGMAHSDIAAKDKASFFRRWFVNRVKSKYEGTMIKVFCLIIADLRRLGIICGTQF